MKTFSKILLLSAVCVMAVCAVSCEKEPQGPSQQDIESNIIGKWKLVRMDGKEVVTNLRMVCTYHPGGKSTLSTTGYKIVLDKNVWLDNIEFKYSLNGNVLKEEMEGHWREATIKSIDANRMTLSMDKSFYKGQTTELGQVLEFVKVTADFSQDIIGMWEGVEVTGEETYGGAEACIEYRADGSYTYYTKKGDGWEPSANIDNEYNVDGDWLATRWRPEAGADYNYEWWDIESIKDGQMKWTALRSKEDGSTYATTFTWKKVQLRPTFYVGGNVAGDAAYIYKDNELLYRLDDNAGITGMAVMDDGIYSCGGIWDWDAKPLPSIVPAIWKDGKRLDVDFGGNVGDLYNMVKRGDDWLCCGTIYGEDGRHGVIIKNGKVVFRSEGAVYFDCMGIGASGNCYVSVSVADGVELWQIDTTNKQLVSSERIATNEEDETWSGVCLYVGTQDIAVGLRRTNQEVEYHAYIWLSGGRGLVDLQENSSVNKLCFFNGYCLAGGCVLTENNASSKAVQWIVNEGVTAQDFSEGCIGNSALRLLMNYEDMFLFQCVQHEGGVQICNDGKMIGEIKTPKDFNATCWDVTVEMTPVP